MRCGQSRITTKLFGRNMTGQNGAKKETKAKKRFKCRTSGRIKRSGHKRRGSNSARGGRERREWETKMLKKAFPLRERWPKNGLLRRVSLCMVTKAKRDSKQ